MKRWLFTRVILGLLGGVGFTTQGYGQLPHPVSEQTVARVEQFRNDLRAFAYDLQARGIPRDRARYLSYIVVTETYRYGIPPALVFGMMAQESAFKPRAVSVAGAQGLMQIMPGIWKPSLGPYFGYDLFDEATNIRYGVWIVAHYAKRSGGDWHRALVRYSGNARQYPEKVRRYVERQARASCPSRDFVRCVELPIAQVFGPAR